MRTWNWVADWLEDELLLLKLELELAFMSLEELATSVTTAGEFLILEGIDLKLGLLAGLQQHDVHFADVHARLHARSSRKRP